VGRCGSLAEIMPAGKVKDEARRRSCHPLIVPLTLTLSDSYT
jgi:hypothetical protein